MTLMQRVRDVNGGINFAKLTVGGRFETINANFSQRFHLKPSTMCLWKGIFSANKTKSQKYLRVDMKIKKKHYMKSHVNQENHLTIYPQSCLFSPS